MWRKLQFLADLVTFTEEFHSGKRHFLCSVRQWDWTSKAELQTLLEHCLLDKDIFKNKLKAFDDNENKQKSKWSNIFWYVKYVYFESVFNTLHIEIKHKC